MWLVDSKASFVKMLPNFCQELTVDIHTERLGAAGAETVAGNAGVAIRVRPVHRAVGSPSHHSQPGNVFHQATDKRQLAGVLM